jgi:hypothetical protein
MKSAVLSAIVCALMIPCFSAAEKGEIKQAGTGKAIGAGIYGQIAGQEKINRGKAKIRRGRRNLKAAE